MHRPVDRVRARRRQDEGSAFLDRLGQVPTRLLGDTAPVLAAHITIAWLPFGSPERTPWEDRWRQLNAVVAATHPLDALATHALSWLDAHPPDTLLTGSGLRSSTFDWLPT